LRKLPILLNVAQYSVVVYRYRLTCVKCNRCVGGRFRVLLIRTWGAANPGALADEKFHQQISS
jgi:hypothetical protein